MDAIGLILVVLAGAVAIPVLTLCIETFAALGLPKESTGTAMNDQRPRAVIIIPAHNEAAVIAQTIENAKAQMLSADRLVVVADNCSDETETIAERLGAEVVLRKDAARWGKGYAIDAGIRSLAQTRSSDIVVLLDADCALGPAALETLVHACATHDAPTQALYSMRRASDDTKARIAEFAWRIRAILIPKGSMNLGLPCQLMGTGMAFPWHVLSTRDLATGHITEDIVLSIELSLDGHPPRFCPLASVLSEFPSSEKGRSEQRKRWIHGYFLTVNTYLFKLLGQALRNKDLSMLAIACQLTVPPLSILAVSCLTLTIASSMWLIVSGSTLPLILSAATLLGFTVFLIGAWLHCGTDLIGPREFASILQHVAGVIRVTLAYAGGDRSTWARADRAKQERVSEPHDPGRA